jgi:hypothetical protein
MYPNLASDYLHLNYPNSKNYTIKFDYVLDIAVIQSKSKTVDLQKIPIG